MLALRCGAEVLPLARCAAQQVRNLMKLWSHSVKAKRHNDGRRMGGVTGGSGCHTRKHSDSENTNVAAGVVFAYARIEVAGK